MGILDQVVKGVQLVSYINIFAGPNGVGKTTMACSPKNCLAIDIEEGSSHIDVARLIPKSYEEFKSIIDELLTGVHQYEAVAIDSIEALEVLIHKEICQKHEVKSIEDIPYGKGFSESREYMTQVMHNLQQLKKKGMTINLVAHTQVKTFQDPARNVTYDRYIFRCNDKLASVVRDLSDNVFFCTYEVHTNKDKGDQKHKAYSDGKRVMYTEWRAAFDAKNRCNLPFELPLDWYSLVSAQANSVPKSAEELTADIKGLIPLCDEGTQKIAKEKLAEAGNDAIKLQRIKTKLQTVATAQ